MAGNESALTASRDYAEERLLIEAAQRDPARFAELYENNFELVYGYVVRRVRERDAAEDLTSDVFHKALEYLPKFKWQGAPFGAWLIKIASNMVADRHRKSAHQQTFNDDVMNVSAADTNLVTQPSLEESEERAKLFRMVGQLPPDQRRVVELRFAADKSIREIAQELGRSEGAVKQLQFRGLENLRSRLAGKSGE
jgi:RNA polymerase sigma-70 factor, ECF subfamily